MMRIGLWSDCHHFPSLPLMKLSAYHKAIGDEVELFDYWHGYCAKNHPQAATMGQLPMDFSEC